MTSKLTREWLQHQISEIEVAGITDSNTLAAFKLALAAMGSEPVAWEVKGILCHTLDEANKYVGTPEPLYRHAQQSVPVPGEMDEHDATDYKDMGDDAAGWIPVTDRMPEDGEMVVIVDSAHGCFYGGAVVIYRPPHFHLMDGLEASNYDGEAEVGIAFEATHWTPLPARPQELKP